MADVAKVKSIFGSYLFQGIIESRKRAEEGNLSLTDTVRLHVPPSEVDFTLEIWVCLSIGKAISQTIIRSVEDWKGILGDVLFDSMMASRQIEEDFKEGLVNRTRAINICSAGSDDGCDHMLNVKLGFEAGFQIWRELYPLQPNP